MDRQMPRVNYLSTWEYQMRGPKVHFVEVKYFPNSAQKELDMI